MQRISMLFAISSTLFLTLGLFISRLGPFRQSSMTYTWNGASYMIPNQMLCFGIGCSLAFFSFLYSAWFIPYGTRVPWWHLGLSIGCSVAFFSSFALTGGDTKPVLWIFAAMVLTPYLFVLIQAGFALNAFCRIVLWSRH